MKTLTKRGKDITHDWYVIDAKDQVLGRISTKIAAILRGKHNPQFSPNLDLGDYVVVINAEQVKLTRNKELQKTYDRYSGYPGGLKQISYKRMMSEHPEKIIENAVKGMLPKNALGRQMLKKLKVYCGEEHPHIAQAPKTLS